MGGLAHIDSSNHNVPLPCLSLPSPCHASATSCLICLSSSSLCHVLATSCLACFSHIIVEVFSYMNSTLIEVIRPWLCKSYRPSFPLWTRKVEPRITSPFHSASTLVIPDITNLVTICHDRANHRDVVDIYKLLLVLKWTINGLTKYFADGYNMHTKILKLMSI